MTKPKQPKQPKPPAHWETRYRMLWGQVLEDWTFSTSELQTLRVGIEALRRRDQARELVDKEGLVLQSATGTAHAHPGLTIEKNSHMQWIAAFRALSLKESDIEIRPGRPGGGRKIEYA